jgi:hypothetical protein
MATFTDASLNAAIDAVAALGTWVSMHTGNPGTTGANEVAGGSYGRQQTTWGAASGGARAGSQVTINIPAATTITHWGFWSASSAGTFRGGDALDASETFGSAGTIAHTPTIDANSV